MSRLEALQGIIITGGGISSYPTVVFYTSCLSSLEVCLFVCLLSFFFGNVFPNSITTPSRKVILFSLFFLICIHEVFTLVGLGFSLYGIIKYFSGFISTGKVKMTVQY